ncbi:hypothetical protein, partial [Thermoflexus sp.]|uniref:hypothetical protein n=1 Tax=Thermoflexus sp. TaxID=1969742 RepID=UPI0035E436C4
RAAHAARPTQTIFLKGLLCKLYSIFHPSLFILATKHAQLNSRAPSGSADIGAPNAIVTMHGCAEEGEQ